MKYFTTLILILISTLSFAFTITKNGVGTATVITKPNASAEELYAQNEFIKYVEAISGAKLSLKGTEKNKIYIETKDTLKPQEISIYCKGNNLYIAGGKDTGIIYAVYEFLEKYFGVMFLAQDDEYIPQNPSMEVGNISYKYKSPFFDREVLFLGVVLNKEFAIKMRNNGAFNFVPKELGNHYEILDFCHSMFKVFPAEKYGKDHPEWFAEREGKRVTKPGIFGTQPCFTNQEAIKQMTKDYLKHIEENPKYKVIDISQNDTQEFCQCKDCQASYEKYGCSGTLLNCVNPIADAVKEKYPDKIIETIAYHNTRSAPKGGVVPRDNVIIRLCSIECDFSKPFTHKANADFMKDLKDWGKITNQLYVWDYVVNFSNYTILHPNFRVFQSNLQTMANNSVVAVYEHGDNHNSDTCFYDYKQYILSKLMWNPNIDFYKETERFMKAYYGDAGEDYYNLIKYLDAVMANKNVALPTNIYDNNYFTADNWKKLLNASTPPQKKQKIPNMKIRLNLPIYA